MRPAGIWALILPFWSSVRFSVIAVAMNPGATALAVMPRVATSAAMDLVMPIMPAFDAA